MLELCDWGCRHGYRHYFCGGQEGVAAMLAERLANGFGG
jgi:UDP-N-acetyl-D-mannosaminuronic acid transferase (WecB/TagA/CpsF family)